MKNWSISQTGPRPAVVAKVLDDEAIPMAARNWIAELINALPGEFNGASVDAHAVFLAGMANIHVTVKPTQLTL